MTRLERELKCLEVLGLEVGDYVRLLNPQYDTIYKIERDIDGVWLRSKGLIHSDIENLIKWGFKKVPVTEINVKMLLGQYKCKDVNCEKCPLRYIECFEGDVTENLYSVLEIAHTKWQLPIYVYNYIHNELDKEPTDEQIKEY